MTESPNGKQQRRSFLWLITLTILYTVSLLGWPIAITIVGMGVAGAGQYASHIVGAPILNFLFLLAWAYPLVVIIGILAAWLQYNGQHYRAAFWVSVIPLANIFLVLLGLALLSLAIAGRGKYR